MHFEAWNRACGMSGLRDFLGQEELTGTGSLRLRSGQADQAHALRCEISLRIWFLYADFTGLILIFEE